MSETNPDPAPDADRPIFTALLTPHRSLGPRGFAVLMIVLATVCFGYGLFFLSIGAWPVFGFLGLDVLLVYLAFRINYRSGRAREEVSISRLAVEIRKIAPSGRSDEHRFDTFWTRFAVRRHQEIGITSMLVEGQGRSVPVGAFLNPEDRESFAAAFGRALATARAG